MTLTKFAKCRKTHWFMSDWIVTYQYHWVTERSLLLSGRLFCRMFVKLGLFEKHDLFGATCYRVKPNV